MSLVNLTKAAFPDAWEKPSSADGKAEAVSHVIRVLEALRDQYGGGQVDAVVRGLVGPKPRGG